MFSSLVALMSQITANNRAKSETDLCNKPLEEKTSSMQETACIMCNEKDYLDYFTLYKLSDSNIFSISISDKYTAVENC